MILEGDVVPSVLSRARSYIGRSIDDVRAEFGADAVEEPSDEYQALEGLSSIENEQVFPGTLYLRAGAVELVYVGYDASQAINRDDLERELDGEAVLLPSRAGKRVKLSVRAELGVAYAVEGDQVHFIEVFRPRAHDAYEAEIYRPPKAFIR